MKKVFIAYFDLLGYKEFLLANTDAHLAKRVDDIIFDIERALSQDTFTKTGQPDLSHTTIRCLTISDTVIFWSADNSIKNGLELCKVAWYFNYRMVCHNFPLRGTIAYDKFDMITGSSHNAHGAVYSLNSMYGKGLYNVHANTEALNWSGSVIDVSVMDELGYESDFKTFLNEKAIEYDVPYKNGNKKQYALRLSISPTDEKVYENMRRAIRETFEKDNKPVIDSVEKKIDNTLKFYELHKPE